MTDITIAQGTDGGLRWLVEDSNGDPYVFSGWTVAAQIRDSAGDSTILHTFSTALGTASAGSDGYVTITWTHAATSAWTFTRGVYDIELTSGAGNVSRLDGGRVTVTREVTRS